MRQDGHSLAIRVRGLSVQYDAEIFGVRDVDLDVMQGEVVGIIGPNGAGKRPSLSVSKDSENVRPVTSKSTASIRHAAALVS